VKVKKLTKVLLMTVLSSVVLFTAACRSNNGNNTLKDTANATDTSPSNATNKSNSKQSDKPVNITFFASPPSTITDLKTNWFTKYVEEQFNLKIDWSIASGSWDDIKTKQSLLLASGNYPEVFWNGRFTTTDIMKYSQQGILVPLNDLIKEYAPNVQNAIDTVGGLKGITTAPDGNIYGLPNYNSCMHCNYAAKFWMDTSLLEKYGLEMPTTTEEFENVLQVFKDKGGKDFIPLTGANNGWNSNPIVFLMNAFSYDDEGTLFKVDDGKVSFSASTPEWREGLRYINRLFSKGLLDKQFLSQKEEVVVRNVAQGKVGVIAEGATNGIIEGGADNPNFKNWRTVAPLKGPGGVQHAAFFGTQPTELTFVMTKDSTKEQQIAMMKLLNFIWTPEGTQTLNFGPEGKHWAKAAPGELGLNGQPALFSSTNAKEQGKFYAQGKTQNDGWDQMGPVFGSETLRNLGTPARPPLEPLGDQTLLHLETLKDYLGKQPAQVYPGAVWAPADQVDKYGMYRTNINKFVNEWTASFVAGNKSVDKDWQAYLDGLEKLGLKKYLQMSQDFMREPFDTSGFKPDPAAVEFLLSL